MRALTGALGLVWAAANLLAAWVLVTKSFTALVPAKEGGLAQLLILLGGLALAVFAVALGWSSLRLALGETPND